MIEDLTIEQSEKSPGVILTYGSISFEGKAIVNDARAFFSKILHWLDQYLKDPAQLTVVSINLEYMDSASTQYIFQVLSNLKVLPTKDKQLKIIWYYAFDDLEMLELGEVIQARLKIPFEYAEMTE